MAIQDNSKKPYIIDNDTNVYIGLDLPIRRANTKEGFFASTSTTIEAVKNNIRNLIQTHQGERLMQPTLGLNLRNYLFNQITEDTVFKIQNEIMDIFEFWLPFVVVRDIQVKTADNDRTIDSNKMLINIVFSIQQDPNTTDSIQIIVADEVDTGQQSDTVGGSTVGGY
jgi:phage baseplate assembly protein W